MQQACLGVPVALVPSPQTYELIYRCYQLKAGKPTYFPVL